MTRKKVTLAYIANDSERKASFRKRKKGLLNKVREISTLCDVDACAIIYSKYDEEPEVWPSPERARAVLARLGTLSEMDRTRKMLNHESFIRQRIKKTQDQVDRIRKENKRRDLEQFMYRCIAGTDSMDRFDRRNSADMSWVINQTLRDLRSRLDAFNINGGGDGQGASTSGTAVEAQAQAPAPAPSVVVEEVAPTGDESMEGYLMSLVQSPSGAGASGLGWDIGELAYPYMFNNSNEHGTGSGARR